MKVLFTFLTFGKNIFAGMENSIYQLCKGIGEIGHEPVVFTSYAYGSEKIIDGIKVYRSRFLPTSYEGGDSTLKRKITEKKTEITSDLLQVLKKEKPDCIISWDPLWGFIQYLDIEKKVTIPIILSFRVVNLKSTLKKSKKFPFKKFFALSEFLRDEILKKGFTTEIEILPNSIDSDFLINKHLPIDQRKKVIICNARLSPEKGIPFAVKAFSNLLKKHSNFELWLCSGEFPFGDVNKTKQKIIALNKKLKIERSVVFLPNLNWDDIPGLIAQAYISILPSLSETFGRSALESLAVGTPIIGTNIGNLSNLIGECGILVDPKSSDQIYFSLVKLIEDEDYYKRYFNKGLERAKMFDRKIIARQLVSSLKEFSTNENN